MKTKVAFANPRRLAEVVIGVEVPKGFGEQIDGCDGERVGTNIATLSQWEQLFTNVFEALQKYDPR